MTQISTPISPFVGPRGAQLSISLLAAGCVWMASPAVAVTWVVEADGSGDAANIPTGIAMASAGDTVLVADGNYQALVQDEYSQWVGVAIAPGVVLRSMNGPEATIIDVGDDVLETRGISLIDCDSPTIVEGFTITGGNGYDGAAAWIRGGAPILRDNIFLEAYGGLGGSISVMDLSAPTIEDNVFESSYACCGVGGAIYALDSHVTIRRNAFLNCESAWDGGAIALDYASGEISDNQFENNLATNGGAILVIASNASFDRNVITGNVANSNGGAVAYYSGAAGSFSENAVTGNLANGNGGGLYIDGSSPSIDQSTISFNQAWAEGGGVYMDGTAIPAFESSIIARNLGSGGIVASHPASVPTFSCTDAYGNEGDQYAGFIVDPTGKDGNRSVPPLFCSDGIQLQFCSPLAKPADCGQIGASGVGCGCGRPQRPVQARR